MSIIYEALKKAESREGKKKNDLSSGKEEPLKTGRLSKSENKKKIRLVFVILFLILVLGLVFLLNPVRKQFKKVSGFSDLNIKKINLDKLSNFFKTDIKPISEYTLNGIV